MQQTHFGTRFLCGLFGGQELRDQHGALSGEGTLQRLPECLEASIQYTPVTCPCGAPCFQRMGDDDFVVDGPDAKSYVTARVPVWHCSKCKESFMDADAEEIRHEATCVALGRMTSREIQALRRSLLIRLTPNASSEDRAFGFPR